MLDEGEFQDVLSYQLLSCLENVVLRPGRMAQL